MIKLKKLISEQEIDYSINPDTGDSLLDKGYENLQPGDKIQGRLSDNTLVILKVITRTGTARTIEDISWYKIKVNSIQNRDDQEIIKVGDKGTVAWYSGDPLSSAIFNTGNKQAGKKYGAYKSTKYNHPLNFTLIRLNDIKIIK